MNGRAIFEPEISSKVWQGISHAHWPVKRLKWSIAGLFNGIWGDDPDGDHDIICIRVADFDRVRRSVVAEPPTVRSVSSGHREQRVLKKGDLLIEKSGGGDNQLVGCVVHFDHDFEAVCSNFIARVPLQNRMAPRYWNYVHSSLYSARLNFPAIKQTTGIQNLDAEAYFNIEVGFPPIDEQSVIANYLDRESARIDRLIAEKQRMLALLEEKHAALISRVVTRGLDTNAPLKPTGQEWLGEIPAHWEMPQLRFVCISLKIGPFGTQLHAEAYVDNGVPVINPAHLKGNRITPDYGISVDEETAERLAVHRFAEDDIVFGRRGELGRCGIVELAQVNWLCGTGSLRVRCNKNLVDPRYVALVFNGTPAATRLTLESVGSTMDNLNTEMLGHFRIPLPPLGEQRNIVHTVETDRRKASALRDNLQLSITLAKERRAALITAAVTGQIPLEEMTG